MRHLGTMGTGMIIFFFLVRFLNFLCISLLDLSSRHRFVVTEDTGHLLFSAFSWWSLYYVKAYVP